MKYILVSADDSMILNGSGMVPYEGRIDFTLPSTESAFRLICAGADWRIDTPENYNRRLAQVFDSYWEAQWHDVFTGQSAGVLGVYPVEEYELTPGEIAPQDHSPILAQNAINAIEQRKHLWSSPR